MKKTAFLKNHKISGIPLLLVWAVFLGLFPVYTQTASERAPIDINLIIDGSESFTLVKDEITTWVSRRLDQILAEGDRVTVWSAGPAARVIYSGRIDGAAEREAVNRSIREISPSGSNADFSGALREANARVGAAAGFSYTLLISASPAALSSVLSGPYANLLRISRVEEFSEWRALIVGLNLDARVRRAAAAFLSAQ